jgi:tagaturonate reductase
MKVIISNTTEVGITLVEDDVKAAPPVSFPGKLLAFLLARYTHFKGSVQSGMVIIPTELIPDNGTKLKDIVVEQARRNKLDEGFVQWLQTANAFCNSLVDRIVPGKLPEADHKATEAKLGYTDELMIMSEAYRLWAIEASAASTKEVLSFSRADAGVVIASDIDKFRELKLRLLNGSHTFTCGLAVLAGFSVVKQAMTDNLFSGFITALMMDEIAPAIQSGKVTEAAAREFTGAVLDRFRNPFIEHQWLSICLQYTSKMKMRNIPAILWYYEKKDNLPQHMAAGFAAYLLFMKSVKQADGSFAGNIRGKEYVINDDYAGILHQHWQQAGEDLQLLVNAVLKDSSLWSTDLAALPGFAGAVYQYLQLLTKGDMPGFFKKISGERIVS